MFGELGVGLGKIIPREVLVIIIVFVSLSFLFIFVFVFVAVLMRMTLGAMMPGKSLVGSIKRSTSTPGQ